MGEPTSIQIQCNQRNKYQDIIIPSGRFEMLNPYIGSQFTPIDFDMRRKAEILKYSNNASNSKTNNNTSNQRFSQLVQQINRNRNSPKSSYIKTIYFRDSETYLEFYVIPYAIDYTCNTTTIVRKPSSNSNVPGNIELYEDKSVPLYKYKNFNNYAVVSTANNYNILINSDINNLVIDNQTQTQTYVYSLYSINPNQSSTHMILDIPISLYVNGTVKSGVLGNDVNISKQNSFFINSITFSLHYNPELYDNISDSIQGDTITVDVSNSISIDVSFQYNDISNTQFQYIQYLDTIRLDIPNIDTSNKFIYDVYVNSNITPNTNEMTEFDISYGIIFNVENNYDISVNSSINSTVPDPLNNGYESFHASSNNSDTVVETIFKNKYFADLNALSQITYQEQEDISQNIALTKYSYVDVEKYYTDLVYQNVYILKNTTLTNNIYNVEDIRYNPNVYYTLSEGVYYFVNIPESHPIAILNGSLIDNNNAYYITYSNNNDVGYNQYLNNNNTHSFNNTEQYQFGPEQVNIELNDPENGDYIFMYGTVKVEVNGDFDKASIYCLNHGFMGNRYLLRYGY
jgi:hypothetical protein